MSQPMTAFTSPRLMALSTAGVPLVRRGETVRLLWDQDGIRLVIPAIGLDPGGEGEKVRARIARGGRIVPAIVVSAEELRAAF
jgi:flagella basal body P-ring formation protein FlgA